MIEHLIKEKAVISENRDTTAEAVEVFFDQMRATLNEREKALLSTVKKYADIKLKELDSHHQKLKHDCDSITTIVDTDEKKGDQ